MKKLLTCLLFGSLACLGTAQTFTETQPLQCGDTVYISGLGYPGGPDAHIVARPARGHALLLGDFIAPNVLQYIAPPYSTGPDTVIIECARATLSSCDTGIYVFDLWCETSLEPAYATILLCNDSVFIGNLNAWQAPTILLGPEHGSAQIFFSPNDAAGIAYRPDPGFEGVDFAMVGLAGSQDSLLYLFQVYCDVIAPSASEQQTAPQALPAFPNPVRERLFFQAPAGPLRSHRLLDAQGRELPCRLHKTPEGFELDASALANGLYFLLLRIGEQAYWVKFVKS